MRMRKRKSLHQIKASPDSADQKSEKMPEMQENNKSSENQADQSNNQTANAQENNSSQQSQDSQQNHLVQDSQGNQEAEEILELGNAQSAQGAQSNQGSQKRENEQQTTQQNENYENSQNNLTNNDSSIQNNDENSGSNSSNDNGGANQKSNRQQNSANGEILNSSNNTNNNGDDQNSNSDSTPANNNNANGNSGSITNSNGNSNNNSDSSTNSNSNANSNNGSSSSNGNKSNTTDGGKSNNNNSSSSSNGSQHTQNQQNQQNNQNSQQTQQIETDLDSKLPPIDKSLDKNVKYIENTLGKSTDLIIRKFPFNPANDRLIAVVFIDGLCDGSVVNDYIMESLMQPEGKALTQLDKEKIDTTNVLQLIKDRALTFGDIHDLHDYNTLFHSLMSGDAILFVDGEAAAIAASVRGWRDRGVSETSSENVVRGSRESFSESIRTNTALVRRRIKEPTLWMESRQIGHVSRTDVAIMYIKGLVNDQIVQEVNTRLDQIDIDSILETGYIEELIQDETMTPFPTIYNTERPDVIAAELLEGKIAIFVDGTPIVLAVPAPFVSFMHAAEDYYQRADISSFIRILRYVGLVISLLSPSFYIAVTTFHQEMIPTSLLMSLASQREYVPFPAFIEALLMELTFEILREAGVRMPKYIGAAVSIVGTLVIGQAAVQAGFISAAMVIVVSLTAISSFVLPSYNMSIAFRMLRFPLMGLAASFGLVGIFVGCTAIILHLCSLRTFGVPYMTPFGPFVPSDIKDTLLRLPHRFMITRPRLINQKNIRRQSRNSGQKPPKPR